VVSFSLAWLLLPNMSSPQGFSRSPTMVLKVWPAPSVENLSCKLSRRQVSLSAKRQRSYKQMCADERASSRKVNMMNWWTHTSEREIVVCNCELQVPHRWEKWYQGHGSARQRSEIQVLNMLMIWVAHSWDERLLDITVWIKLKMWVTHTWEREYSWISSVSS